MQFLKSNQLELNPAGYLVSKVDGKPVNHPLFVMQQRAAEYTVKLAEAIKDKNFKQGNVDNLEAIKQEVLISISNASTRNYVSEPKEPVSKVQDELTKHALDFVKFLEKKEETSKVNSLMNQFNKIDDVENVGDYFEEGLVKLNEIYTIKQILAAIKITVDKLD